MTFYLYQNQVNYIYPTLSESTTLSAVTPYYLFRLYDQTTQNEVFFTSANISTNTIRYDKFEVTLTGASDINLTAGTISLLPQGDWIYYAYQMSGQTNLSLSGITPGPREEWIETGIVKVIGNNLDSVQLYYSGAPDTYTYYNANN